MQAGRILASWLVAIGPPPFNHAKLTTVDGLWCLVGGANWDVRSFRLNFELNMELYHADIVQRVDGLMAVRRGALIPAAELDGLPLPIKLIDSGARLMLSYL